MLKNLTLNGAYNLYNNYGLKVQVKKGKVIISKEEA